ncbi:PREDICTED: ectonucleoside triphosphate diphosphohydrolase 2-like [Branchiostoma belcheri]|uniref:Ectonucleoside triphosphate diphosphohydrolase 2-like n=1 Tax=Branchiostoma belcheri TaxID=7741 RepID=A0A6P4Z1T3_BRABE|nr:PREDICTED: ectonucleoside triphosphate diphosphohydrolase 2-like [Branchiostoma belcheri]
MHLIIESTLNTCDDKVTLDVQEQDSVIDTIYRFCRHRNVDPRIGVLRNEKGQVLNPTYSLSLCGIKDGDTVYLGEPDMDEVPASRSCDIRCTVIAAAAVLIGTIGLIAVCVSQGWTSSLSDQYGIVLDAGSTHTQLFVYRWPGLRRNDTAATVTQVASCRAEGPGISGYSDDPTKAGPSLDKCLSTVAMTTVPSHARADTPIYLGATAGMRLLRDYHVYAHSFLCYGRVEAERRFFANLVVAGNYTSEVENPCAPSGYNHTFPASYLFEAPCSQGKQALLTWGSEVTFPDHLDVAETNFTMVGSSSYAGCVAHVDKLFNFSEPCDYASCSFNGVYQPSLHGNFQAFSFFYYVVDFLNLTRPGNFSISEFNTNVNTYCSKTWKEVQSIPGPLLDQLALYCLDAQYIYTLLVKGYGFEKDTWNVTFINQVKETNLGWALGFMLNTTNLIPSEAPIIQSKLSLTAYALLIVLFVVFLLLGVGFSYSAYKGTKSSKDRYRQLSNYGSV